jgi:hypothetical protein
MTDLRKPRKVLDRANGEAATSLKNAQRVGSLVSAKAMPKVTCRPATRQDVMASLEASRERVQPVLSKPPAK